jgi:hypothetical protein
VTLDAALSLLIAAARSLFCSRSRGTFHSGRCQKSAIFFAILMLLLVCVGGGGGGSDDDVGVVCSEGLFLEGNYNPEMMMCCAGCDGVK